MIETGGLAPSDRPTYVVIGNGPAGVRASETLRKADRDARVIVVSEEDRPFYNRIPLSKEFLVDDAVEPDRVVIKPTSVYEAQGIELWTGSSVASLDPERHVVTLADRATIAYDGCVIATGARPSRLDVPGFDAPGVHTLRTLDDAVTLRRGARRASRAVIIGGGLIGIEVAVALAKRGVACTLIAREPWLYGHVAPEPVGRTLAGILETGGVSIVLEATVGEIGTDGDRRIVRTDDGRAFEGDIVPVGVGVRPNVEFLDGSGLAGASGVHVDAFLRTSTPDVVAAGDVAAFADPVTGVRHRVEHWLHAQHQGRAAARALLSDAPEPFARVTSYDTRLFDVPIAVVGSPGLASAWSFDGDLAAGSGVALGERDGSLIAAFVIGDPGVRPAEISKRIESVAEGYESA